MTRICNVCGSSAIQPVFESGEKFSLTTMNTLVAGETVVSYCPACDHVQTDELPNLVEYYAQDYVINLDSADDDQLYAVVDGKEVYRSDHQAAVLAQKIDLTKFRNVLDYGCAKAPSLRKLLTLSPGVKPHLFDVTDKYIEFWKDFPVESEWAVHEPKDSWVGQMDVVLSFYALEHIPHLKDILADVSGLLRDGGYFYFLVPNVYENAADFIVADHVNHFSRNSLRIMLSQAGFVDIDIDEQAHAAAFVVCARIDKTNPPKVAPSIPEMEGEARRLADFWGGIKDRIQSFEAALDDAQPRGIYGAGIYGNFILSCLKQPERVACFLDQNKFLIGTEVNGVKIRHPMDAPDDLDALLVGLNPKIARRVMSEVSSFESKNLTYFFLDEQWAA